MTDIEDSLDTLTRALPKTHLNLITAKDKQQFDDAFSAIVIEAVRILQKSSKNYAALGEDGLSDALAGIINGTKALVVTREEDSNGHADFTFKAELCNPSRYVLGEAKVFNYYEWHKSGLTQLLGYCTGSEERSLLLEYVKKPDIQGYMGTLRTGMNEDLPCDQTGPCTDHDIEWSFLSTHKHSSGKQVEVWHLGCNMHHPKNDAKAPPEPVQLEQTLA